MIPQPLKTPKRRSRLLKLPAEFLEQVNVMLEEDATYQAIVDFLAANGFPNYTIDMLYHWREGGFQDWLAQQRQRCLQQDLLNWSLEETRDQDPRHLAAAMLHFGGAKIFECINQLSAEAVKASLNEHPEVLPQFFSALAWLSKEAVQLQRLETQPAGQKENAPLDDTQPARPETIEKANQTLNLI